MQPVVRHLLIDHARRTSWLWLLGCLAFIGAACAYFDERRSVGKWLYFIFATMPLVTAHTSRSLYRYLPKHEDLTLLPISDDEVARFLWWVRIGVPGLIVSATNLLVYIGARSLGHTDLSLWEIAIWLLLPCGLFGLQKFVPELRSFDTALIYIFGVAPGLLYTVAFLPHTAYTYTMEVAVIVIGICAAAFSYLHSDRLGSRSANTRRAISAIRSNERDSSKQSLSNPWNKVITLYFGHPLTWGSLLLFAVLLIFHRTLSEVNKYVVPVTIGLILSALPKPIRRIVSVLGQLRALPVRLQTAAAIIYALSITPTLLVCVVGLAIIPEAGAMQYAGVAGMLCIWSLLLLPTILWQQFVDGEVAKVISLIVWPMGIATAMFIATTNGSYVRRYLMLAVLLAATVSIGYELIRRGIERMGRDKLREAPRFKGEH